MAETSAPESSDPKPSADFYTGKTAAKRNYYFGLLGFLFGLIGIALSVYFYLDSLAGRDLQFKADYPSGELVKSGHSSGLSVSFNGVQISQDISVTQIAIWNAGKLPIRKEHILVPLSITFEAALADDEGRTITNESGKPIVVEDSRLLEAKVRSVTRDEVVGFKLDSSQLAAGRIGITWNILEEDDGVLIQVIYAGNSALKAKLNGVVEGPLSSGGGSFTHPRFWLRILITLVPLAAAAFVMLGGSYIQAAVSPGSLSSRERIKRLVLFAIAFVCFNLALFFPQLGSRKFYETSKQPPQRLFPQESKVKK